MSVSSERVTARMSRTESGEVLREYVVGGVAYGSLESLRAALAAR